MEGRTPLTVRSLLIMLAEIEARYDALIRDARLRNSPEAEYWEKEKNFLNEEWRMKNEEYF